MKKFNFLDRRTSRSKAEDSLRRQFPKRSTTWINAKARQLAGNDDVAAELHAAEFASVNSRGGK